MPESRNLRPIGLEEIQEIEARSYKVIEHLNNLFQSEERHLEKRFSISKAAEMVGRSTAAIRDAEKDGRLPSPLLNVKGRRAGYSLKDVNQMRSLFTSLPHRNAETDECLVMAVQNFKGGCGKSTITVHISQYLALQGYRVCVIDCDPQASTTALFGMNPDHDVSDQETMAPYFMGDQTSLNYALRKTHWDQLSLIPANLGFYEVEYAIAANTARGDSNGNMEFLRLRDAIATISDKFDVVIIDPPPALGMISLSVLNAANALIVPVKPATIDFASTAHFFTMLIQTFEILKNYGVPEPRFKFLKVLDNALDESKSAHVAVADMMSQVYGSAMLSAVMKNSAEIDNASARLQSVYELDGPITSRETHNRCKAYLNAVNKEIELLIRHSWPSHHESLKQQGLL